MIKAITVSRWNFKQVLLLIFSSVLLVTGSTLLWRQVKPPAQNAAITPDANAIVVNQTKVQSDDLTAAFTADSVMRLGFQQSGKEIFNLLLAAYRDSNKEARNVLLYPKNPQESIMLPTPMGQRQNVWQLAAETIKQKAPKNALFLSWWDDSQRIHFLTGRETWLSKPGLPTFNSALWKNLQPSLLQASEQEQVSLQQMARWLTMDNELAIKEISKHFGTTKPIYLLVNNDLLMRLAEFVDYGGTRLVIHSKMVSVSDNLHNDISRIKRLAQEEGDGNYLVQKEGLAYHLWIIPKGTQAEKNSLLVRLLPFVDSLKQLPPNLSPTYLSAWGNYLSIYQLSTQK
jgi:hydroxylamine oxidation protein HaoB